MSACDFDAPVDRAGTWSSRWERYAGRDVLPLWVADTDFKAPPPVLKALAARLEHGVLGYTVPPRSSPRRSWSGCSGSTTGR